MIEGLSHKRSVRYVGLYMLHIILHADPDIHPSRLLRLNCTYKREAMFLAYRAIVTSTELTIFTKLRIEDKHLLQHVISFL